VTSIAIESYLVDASPPTAPTGFTVLRSVFSDGVPRELAIADGWSAVVQVPTGVAKPWLESEPAEIVASSAQAHLPHLATGDEAARATPRLVIKRAGVIVGALPLSVGTTGVFHADTGLLELVPLTWELRVGAMRGNTPGSGRLELAWRSRTIPRGVVTGDPGAGGSGGGGGGGGAGVAPAERVIVTREDPNERNVEFQDVVTKRRMTRVEFVAAIRAGDYPGYEVRMLKGVETPVSRRTPTDADNLG
jgi:hypothetical protein